MSHPAHGEVNAFLDSSPLPPLASTCLKQVPINVLSRILGQAEACPVMRPRGPEGHWPMSSWSFMSSSEAEQGWASCQGFLYLSWMLGIEPRSSVRASVALNH